MSARSRAAPGSAGRLVVAARELRGSWLLLEVNSVERAGRGERMLEELAYRRRRSDRACLPR
jgi:hypothetical protein